MLENFLTKKRKVCIDNCIFVLFVFIKQYEMNMNKYFYYTLNC